MAYWAMMRCTSAGSAGFHIAVSSSGIVLVIGDVYEHQETMCPPVLLTYLALATRVVEDSKYASLSKGHEQSLTFPELSRSQWLVFAGSCSAFGEQGGEPVDRGMVRSRCYASVIGEPHR